METRENKKQTLKTLICRNCEKTFLRNRPWQVHCCEECRKEYWKKTSKSNSALNQRLLKLEQKIKEMKEGGPKVNKDSPGRKDER